VAGCGTERQNVPDPLEVKSPQGQVSVSRPDLGLRFQAPRNWHEREGEPPRVLSLASGEALVSVWAYPRTEPLPRTKADLEEARIALEAEIRKRDPLFSLESSRVTRVAGAPAIDIVGQQTIARRRLRVRSVHAFKGGREYVIDALAPPGGAFERMDGGAVRMLLETVELG